MAFKCVMLHFCCLRRNGEGFPCPKYLQDSVASFPIFEMYPFLRT
jgi:hypothetical protein